MKATLSKKAQAEQEKESARAYLLSIMERQEKPTLYTSLKSVSSSGMSRDMKVLSALDGQDIRPNLLCREIRHRNN
jgi:hypothetical protein